MPRAGSMWTFNVTRSALHDCGFTVMPKQIPHSNKEMIELSRRALKDEDSNSIHVLKVHSPLSPDDPNSRIIVPRRDLRDALISYWRFSGTNFKHALAMAKGSGQMCDHYAAFSEGQALQLDYETIRDAPKETLGRVAKFLHLDLDDEATARICRRFSKDKVQKLISDTERQLAEDRKRDGNIAPERYVKKRDGTYRAFDLATGFQGGHVSDYRDGDWRKILTNKQNRIMHEVLGDWLSANGYLVD